MAELSPPQIITRKLDVHLWWITALLIAINIALFAWQILQGMDATQPSTQDALRWGADYAPLSFSTEPMRLFSSMFFHFGLIHLALNMWALYIFGSIAEQMLGRAYFIALYVLAGVMGSLLSGYMSIQDSYALLAGGVANASLLPSVSAGASGAVMGIGAALTVLAVLPVLPRQRFILDKKSLLIIMAINLAMGFSISGINNAAHMGGMLMGILLSLFWYMGQKWQKTKLINVIAVVAATLLCYGFYLYCHSLVAEIAPLWQELIRMMQQQGFLP